MTRTAPPTSFSRPPKVKPQNPVEAAVQAWRAELSLLDLTENQLNQVHSIVSSLPKRWVVYHPMVLFPAGSCGSRWAAKSPDLVIKEKQDYLWQLLLEAIGRREGKGVLTHLAVNAGIPLDKPIGQADASWETTAEDPEAGNVLRSPSGLIMLYGDFGPSLHPSQEPTFQDFKDAFWVSTKQNGITQVWAPRYTMFSRGNIKEKARLLDFHVEISEHAARSVENQLLSNGTAIDLYAGIGYFVFSYVKMGLKRVIGWEINPWSVEGMRRGALENGWNIRIIRKEEILELGSEDITVVAENNELALNRIQGLGQSCLAGIIHINCGLLPTSQPIWRMASNMTIGDAWLHLHENVSVLDVEKRKMEMEETLQGWLDVRGDTRSLTVEHVELVKTFAPGVWHCVFDIYVSARPVH